MMQRIALKIAASLTGFVWAFASVEKGWGALYTFLFALIALGIGASVALDMGRLSSEDDE